MPLRDHFRSPLDDETSWEGFHGGWPMMIVANLTRILPPRYVAAPRVHTAVWAPPQPTLAAATDLPALDEYEVRVYDTKRGRRLVAAIEIVSPSNKDRPDHRHTFVAKCVALLENRVYVAIVDLVTTRNFNLYGELLASIGQTDSSLGHEPPNVYAAGCHTRSTGATWLLEGWANPLTLGMPLPALPLWLADNLAVPVDLEQSYEETCRILRIA